MSMSKIIPATASDDNKSPMKFASICLCQEVSKESSMENIVNMKEDEGVNNEMETCDQDDKSVEPKNKLEENDDSISYDESDDEDRESDEIFSGRFKFLSMIGATRTGVIYSVFDVSKHKEVVIKSVKINTQFGMDESALAECQALRKLGCTLYAPDLLDAITLAKNYILVFKKERISLDKLLFSNETKKFGNVTVLKLARDATKALEYLHFHNVQHRDIRPSSMLISRTNYLQLTGYGQSVIMEHGNSNQHLTFRHRFKTSYSTPDQLRNVKEDESGDITQLSYTLMEFLGVKLFSSFVEEWEAKVHFGNHPHMWLPDSTSWIFPIIKSLVIQKDLKTNSGRIKYDDIYAEIKKIEPEVCQLAPYHLEFVNGTYRLQ